MSENIRLLLEKIDFDFPVSMLLFYETNANGIEACSNDKSGYLKIFPVDKLIYWNDMYECSKYVGNFFLFGNNGAGEGYAIKKKTGGIYWLDLNALDENYAIFIAENFSSLIKSYSFSISYNS